MASLSIRGGVALPAALRSQLAPGHGQGRHRASPAVRAQGGQEKAGAVSDGGKRMSRKEMLQGAVLAAFMVRPGAAVAEDEATPEDVGVATTAQQNQIFFDLTVDGKPEGRVTIEVFDDAPIGGQRILDLAKGKQGVGYRRSKVGYVSKDFIGVEPLAKLSYGESGISPIAGGDDTYKLEAELEGSTRKHDTAGVVSIVVKDLSIRQPEQKLKAVNGRLMNVPEPIAVGPNGTALSITNAATPSLDATNLVVGRVVEGQDIINRLAALPAVKDNTSSPYFMAAKAIGDKRADVAEKGFNKPYSKIVISKCGIVGA